MSDVPFPALLDPVDDLPPATLITAIRHEAGRLRVRGVSQDNTQVASVKVNGQDATIVYDHAGVVGWEAVLDARDVMEVMAWAVDQAGNQEKTPQKIPIETTGSRK